MTKVAVQVLSDAKMADAALASRKTTSSLADINSALAARDKLAKMANRNGMTMIVPVYAELGETAVLSDAVKSRTGRRRQERNRYRSAADGSRK